MNQPVISTLQEYRDTFREFDALIETDYDADPATLQRVKSMAQAPLRLRGYYGTHAHSHSSQTHHTAGHD